MGEAAALRWWPAWCVQGQCGWRDLSSGGQEDSEVVGQHHNLLGAVKVLTWGPLECLEWRRDVIRPSFKGPLWLLGRRGWKRARTRSESALCPN